MYISRFLVIEGPDVKKTWIVPDMSCMHCQKTIENALGRIPGISVRVHLDTKKIDISGEFDPADVFKVIADAGYSVKTEHKRISNKKRL